MSSSITPSSTPKMIEVTIHRCSKIPTKWPWGDYFVKVAIGSETMQTKQCSVSRRQVVWNERLSFGEVEAPSLTLGLYRLRTLSFLTPELVGEAIIQFSETGGASPQTNPRTLSFPKGGRIEFGLTINATRQQELSDQPVHAAVVDGSSTLAISEQVEHQEPAPEDDSEDRNEPQLQITEDVDGTRDAIEQAQRARRPLEGGWKRLVEGLGLFCDWTGPMAEANSFAQLAHGILSTVSRPFTEQLDREDRIESLLSSFVDFFDLVNELRDSILTASDKLSDVLKRISLQVAEVAFFVRDYYGSGKFLKRALKNVVSTTDETIRGYTSTLEGLKEELQLRLASQTGATIKQVEVKVVRVLEEIKQMSQFLNLDDFAYAGGAGFNKDKKCLTGTRTGILKDAAQWVSSDSSRVLLLLGGAGTGKSAIAHTFASQFKDLGRLGSMFCFSESDKANRNSITLFPHIARDLADLDKNIREELCKAAPTKADRTTSSIEDQFEKLILTPANAIREQLHGPIVIIIDALDESGTMEERRNLLRILVSRLKELPPSFKIIITSRPDVDIQNAFPAGPDFVIKRMDDIPQASTAADIVLYVGKQLEDITEVDSKMRKNIASHAGGLFEWARVGCQFIRGHRLGGSVLSRYEAIIHSPQSNTRRKIRGDNLLDKLYHTVLSKVLTPDDEAAMEIYQFVMGQVLTAFEPLSCNSLNKLFEASRLVPEDCKAEGVVRYLGSLLSGVDRLDAPVVPFHTSFRDFLTNRERSKQFFVDSRSTDTHMDMAWSSLSIMAKELKFNICHLETSYRSNKDVPDLDERIKKYIPPHLLYACRFWSSHLCALPVMLPDTTSDDPSLGGVDEDGWTELMKKLDEVLSHSLLYWLEVLSVTSTVDIGVRQMRQVDSWFKNLRNGDKKLGSLIGDMMQFGSYSAKCIARSAPHIYISALPFSPRKSLVAKKYTQSNDNTLAVAIGEPETYPSCLNILEGHTWSVYSVALSPDGSRIVSGSDDGTIRVWNAEDGTMALDPFRGHTDWVKSVAFSPDGSRIVSGSRDRTIRVWNAKDGTMALDPFRGHTSSVYSVAFSPDGSRIVSGFFDGTIRVWNAEDGSMALDPFRGHTDSVNSVAFSPDGSRIVSGSHDSTIRVWNAEDGTMALDPFRGHTESVNSVAFSPDGSRIVSGSRDRTIRVWNAEDGTMALDPFRGHTESVTSVAFSPDGSRIVSGSHDSTIRVWNAEDGTMALDPFRGHTSSVYSVAFTPDGSRIVSGSDDGTVRVWNAEDGTMPLDPFRGHTDSVNSVAFSPNGSRIVSGSHDSTIRVWNAEDGSMALDPFRGHTESVNSVAFSPDGSRIVSGSRDRTIRVWNAEDGSMALDPFRGHTESVNSVAFSPDGSRIVSGSDDGTIRVWDAEDGTMALDPFRGHTESVMSVAFSPDGSRIVSGSHDGTIRVWNAEDGTMALDPFRGHTSLVYPVAFSPDGSRIVSGSYSGIIQVWNAEDGTMALDSFRGHTDWVMSVAFSPDGSRIVSGSHDGTIRVWNAEDGTMALDPFRGHTDWVKSVAFSPDGSRIVSGSRDNTIRVWNAEDGIMALAPFCGHTDCVNSVTFSSDGSRFVSGSTDNTTRASDAVRLHTSTTSFELLSQQNTLPISSSSCNNRISPSTLAPPPVVGALSTEDILPQFNWHIEDGWSLGPHGELLFYVPPVHRPCLHSPRTLFVIGRDETKLDMSRFAHGFNWTQSFSKGSTSDARG